MWLLYQLAMAVGLVLVAPWMLLRRGTIAWRVARGRWRPPAGEDGRGAVWVHAVSVGEVGVAATLIDGLPPDLPLLVTTVTPTGQDQARRRLGGRAALSYLPFDLGIPVRRFFRRFVPRSLILVEGDLWPLVLRTARRRRLPIVVVNGRIGDRSFRRLRRLRRLLGPLLDPVRVWGVQSDQDAARLAALGVPAERVRVTGNLKFEARPAAPEPAVVEAIRRRAGGRPVLVAGSTMPGEEERVVNAFRAAGGGERALLLLAPRHPERFETVAELLHRGGLTVVRRSELETERATGGDGAPPPDILLLDSLGELAGLYGIGLAAFVGGTLVDTGGHNPLEPMAAGVATVTGPSMHNFRDMAALIDRAGAWRRVRDAAELGAVWQTWLERPGAAHQLGAAGRALVDAHRGARERTLTLLDPLLASAAAAGVPTPAGGADRA